MYPLSAAGKPPTQTFVNLSGLQFNTIHANNFHFYEELNAVIQHEPADAFDPGDRRAVRRDWNQEGQAVRSRRAHEAHLH